MTNPLGIELDVLPEHHPFPSASGKLVYDRTYSRTKPDGTRETWFDTVRRVAKGNLAFVYGDIDTWNDDTRTEYDRLVELMDDFSIIPAGRHLWATGISNREHVSNCFVAGWTDRLSDHFSFTLLRLAEGGGVGANYSTRYTGHYSRVKRDLKVHIVCDPSHPNHDDMLAAGLLSTEYSHEWTGSFPIEDTREGWADALSDLLDTFVKEAPVKHQNRVYDVSRLRPKGSPLRTFGGVASGPEPFARLLVRTGEIVSARFEKKLTPINLMEIDHEIGACVVAGGNRRSARMSMVHWADPHIDAFLTCKTDPSKHWTTNISVEIDDEFVRYIQQDELGWSHIGPVDAKTLARYAKAHRIYKKIITGMLTNGEPGMWNSSLSAIGEPESPVCTNPCAEITLLPWESCILGHINLDMFVDRGHGELAEAHRLMTRFLIRATYGTMNDDKQKEVVHRNRRIGVGHLGVQSYLAKCGTSISSLNEYHVSFSYLLKQLKQECRDEARDYAFQLRIPEPVKVTTVAPTGSIAKMPGVTEGIHPIYARYFLRRIRFSILDPKENAQLEGMRLKGYDVEPCVYAPNTMVVTIPTKEKLVDEVGALGYDAEKVVETAEEISLEAMLGMQKLYQTYYADNAVSFTVNIPAEEHQNEYLIANPGAMDVPKPTPERVREVGVTLRRFLGSLKGTTIMVDGTRVQAPYERITKEQFDALEGPKQEDDSGSDECSSGACPVR